MRTHHQPSTRTTHKGFVLLAVLVFILLLSMITMSLLFRSNGDESAGHATAGSEQAWSAALSGVAEATRVAAAASVGSTDWQDDPTLFRAREVYNDGADQWYFTVFSPAETGALVKMRYGLSDEASRINLNHPGDADLTGIPQITAPLSSALREFVGEDAPATPAPQPQDSSADPVDPFSDPTLVSSTQDSSVTVVPHHGPLATLEEVLLVPGFTRALLHGGATTNNDTVVAAPVSNSSDGPQLPPDAQKLDPSRGVDQYFTVCSRDPSLSSTGQRRCNINNPSDALPASDLPASFSNYVAGVRASKIPLAHVSDALEATVTYKDESGKDVEVASGITKENLSRVLDLFTTDKENGHDGLVNVNTASAAVLATLPSIDVPLAESIVSTRTGLSADRRTTIAWLYQEGVVDADKFKAIAPALTARSTQFHFNVIGYGLPSGRFRVVEAIVDTSGSAARVIYMRDITRLGLPFNLKEENIADPNSGAVSSGASGSPNPHG